MFVVTSIYAALSALLVLVLAMRVVLGRRSRQVGIGDGGDPRLARAIRVHANALENLPIALLLLALYEAGGAGAGAVHAYGATLLVARLLHAFGLSRSAGTSFGRQFGTALTWLVLIGLAVQLLIAAF